MEKKYFALRQRENQYHDNVYWREEGLCNDTANQRELDNYLHL